MKAKKNSKKLYSQFVESGTDSNREKEVFKMLVGELLGQDQLRGSRCLLVFHAMCLCRQEPSDFRKQQLGSVAFANETVDFAAHTVNAVYGGRNDDDWNVGPLTFHFVCNCFTVHLRHEVVQKNQVNSIRIENPQRL